MNGQKGPYLKKIPFDSWATPYQYRSPDVHNENGYDLSSLGPDNRELVGDPADDLNDWT